VLLLLLLLLLLLVMMVDNDDHGVLAVAVAGTGGRSDAVEPSGPGRLATGSSFILFVFVVLFGSNCDTDRLILLVVVVVTTTSYHVLLLRSWMEAFLAST